VQTSHGRGRSACSSTTACAVRIGACRRQPALAPGLTRKRLVALSNSRWTKSRPSEARRVADAARPAAGRRMIARRASSQPRGVAEGGRRRLSSSRSRVPSRADTVLASRTSVREEQLVERTLASNPSEGRDAARRRRRAGGRGATSVPPGATGPATSGARARARGRPARRSSRSAGAVRPAGGVPPPLSAATPAASRSSPKEVASASTNSCTSGTSSRSALTPMQSLPR